MFTYILAILNIFKWVVPNLRHAVSTFCLQGQSSQVQSRLLVAGQSVVQQVSPELEVIVVAGLFVPDTQGCSQLEDSIDILQ